VPSEERGNSDAARLPELSLSSGSAEASTVGTLAAGGGEDRGSHGRVRDPSHLPPPQPLSPCSPGAPASSQEGRRPHLAVPTRVRLPSSEPYRPAEDDDQKSRHLSVDPTQQAPKHPYTTPPRHLQPPGAFRPVGRPPHRPPAYQTSYRRQPRSAPSASSEPPSCGDSRGHLSLVLTPGLSPTYKGPYNKVSLRLSLSVISFY
jgi:hypothetical protein